MAHLVENGNKKGSRPSNEGSASSSGIDIKLACYRTYDEGQVGLEGGLVYGHCYLFQKFDITLNQIRLFFNICRR